jgi:hypothetical protein
MVKNLIPSSGQEKHSRAEKEPALATLRWAAPEPSGWDKGPGNPHAIGFQGSTFATPEH